MSGAFNFNFYFERVMVMPTCLVSGRMNFSSSMVTEVARGCWRVRLAIS